VGLLEPDVVAQRRGHGVGLAGRGAVVAVVEQGRGAGQPRIDHLMLAGHVVGERGPHGRHRSAGPRDSFGDRE
jgi:hypothetical protein